MTQDSNFHQRQGGHSSILPPSTRATAVTDQLLNSSGNAAKIKGATSGLSDRKEALSPDCPPPYRTCHRSTAHNITVATVQVLFPASGGLCTACWAAQHVRIFTNDAHILLPGCPRLIHLLKLDRNQIGTLVYASTALHFHITTCQIIKHAPCSVE